MKRNPFSKNRIYGEIRTVPELEKKIEPKTQLETELETIGLF